MLIDPDEHTRQLLQAALLGAGAEVVASLRSTLAAVYAVRQHRPSVIVADLEQRPSGAWSGLALVATLAKECPDVPLLVTVRRDLAEVVDVISRAMAAGARRVLARGGVRAILAAVGEVHRETVAAGPPG